MPRRTVSVAIVGAGVMGASVAYHLAARGWKDLLLLDRARTAGAGSTGAATGGYRAQFGTAINVRLSLLSREKLRRFAAEIGVDPGYVPAGYLWLAESAEALLELSRARAVQHAEGLTEAIEVGPEEIARQNPAIDLDGVIGGAFCPTDGFIHPGRILEGYLGAAKRLGAEVEWGVEIAGIQRDGAGRIATVRTSREEIDVGSVVNAAGPWAASIAAMAGVDLPIVPLRRQVAVTEPFDLLPGRMPMTIFVGDGFHLRVREGRVLLLRPTPGVPRLPFDTRVDADWIESVSAEARARVPILQKTRIDGAACYAGLYEMSPDKHAILGPAPDCPNLYFINGSSGHGVMHAPALGHLLAEIMADGVARSIDVRSLRPSRFLEAAPNPTSELL